MPKEGIINNQVGKYTKQFETNLANIELCQNKTQKSNTRSKDEQKALKMIYSPYCACSGFVFIVVLNLLICYTSVITAYMKFLSPPLRVVTFRNARWVEKLVWENAEVLLLVIIVWQGYLALIMKKKVSFIDPGIFILVIIYIPSFETQKHCSAEIAQ